MNDNHEREMIVALIEKYQNSVYYLQEAKIKRRITLKLDQFYKDYYDFSFLNQKEEIDYAISTLCKKDYIKAHYIQGDYDQIYLNTKKDIIKKICEEYHLVLINDKRQSLKKVLTSLSYSSKTQDIINHFIEMLDNQKNINKYLDINDILVSKEIIKAIDALINQKEEISLRKLSIILFNNSKKLEEYETKIRNILTYFDKETLHSGNIFDDYNVIKNPNYVYIKGNIIININNQVIDIGKLKSAFSLTTENIKNLEILAIDDIDFVSIENLTSFYDVIKDNTLFVYLGGFHNTLRRELINKIFLFKPQMNYYHFGDIDAGGFRIFLDLCHKTNIPFQMKYMDIDTLIEYQSYCKPLTEHDRIRLESLKNLIDNQLIQYMLNHNIKLEQEIVEYK